MSESAAFRLYERLPVSLQNLACTLAGVQMRRSRYNATFHRALALLKDSQWWPLERQREYQDQQLRALIRSTYARVPYYRELFDARGLTPDDVTRVEDLPKLPILSKSTVRKRFHDLYAHDWPKRRLVQNKTGGTTGTALRLLEDVDTLPWQWATWWRHRSRFDLEVSDPFIVFAGRSVVPLSTMDPPFWRINRAMHQTYVSVHHMLKQNMPALVDYLQTRKVRYYSGYPSALYLLATHLLEHGQSLRHPPPLTMTGAETLLPHQRGVIERALDTRVADQYGASEHVANISECEQHRYHVDMEFGIIEFLPIDGMPENIRRIVCTGLHNPAMPLIRYDIGDIATLSSESCSCGREAPLVERIDGRIESYVVTPDGRQLGRLDFLFKQSPHIEEAQIVQDAEDHIEVRVVRSADYAEADEKTLMHDLRAYLGEEIRIDICYCAEITREANGKFRQIVSHVYQDRYAEVSRS